MVLADTSIWVDHFRKSNRSFGELLEQTSVVTHPWIIGELSCGNLKNRKVILALLKAMPIIDISTDDEVMELIESKKLMGKGIGWIDAHLLASCLISGVPIWTGDKALRTIAVSLGVLF